jgi:phosphonate transport system substrate-binding protein
LLQVRNRPPHVTHNKAANNQEDVMINRRFILAGAAALAFIATGASAQEWKAKYPELTFAVVPAENASGVTERWTPFVAYLSKELGVKVNLRIANDYAAVIEGQRSGNIQIAAYGSASFARARLTGVKTDAFASDLNADGGTGYYSMFFVKASSPYKSIDQLKGKNLGLVDPNSTSGNNVPRFELDKMGIADADAYFGKVVFTGSHENALLALSQGTVDVAANQWTSDDDSTLAQMLRKGMLKSADGSAMKKEDFRIIHKSAPIIGPTMYAYSSDLPDDLKAAIAKAFIESPTKDKAAFDRLSDGQRKGFHPATTKDWDPTIDLIKFVDNLRKKKAS